MKNIQKKIDDIFVENFGITTFNERIQDIQNEFYELMRWNDVKNLKEETGDLLSSLFQLCNENGWVVEDLIDNSLNKIKSRHLQYKSLGRKIKVCILGGNYSPIHNGHIQTAKFILNTTKKFDEVWLLPAYGHMQKEQSVSSEHRLEMCNIAASVDSRIKVFDYEIKNKLAGETFYFIKKLMAEKEITEIYNFSLAIGIDNANNFDKWVNYEELERIAKFVVIPRKGVERDINVNWYLKEPHIYIHGETDIMDISSTYIRNKFKDYYTSKNNSILDELSIYLNDNVITYIIDNALYK